ncbi:MAG TPA: biopolymer transporter ExbD [Bdellovibrionota bacterium]|jgi:biopolymer transport protein ExbD|nr:biopolymer transporter ExbD [Bdellovibrionota bacterium]
MMRRFGKKKKAKPSTGDVSLNITAMADIFTIILVFLLKSYSTSAVSVSPSAGTTLPGADATPPEYETLKIEVGEKAVIVENTTAATLVDRKFASTDLDEKRVSRSLNAVLAKERKRQEIISRANADVKNDGKVMIMADKKTPYQTLKTVLASAAVNGFTDFKLVVVKNE